MGWIALWNQPYRTSDPLAKSDEPSKEEGVSILVVLPPVVADPGETAFEANDDSRDRKTHIDSALIAALDLRRLLGLQYELGGR